MNCPVGSFPRKSPFFFVSLHRLKSYRKPVSRNAGYAKIKTIMKREMNAISELRYRIKRYQAMGNGSMCQSLNLQLRRLLAAQAK